jgi:hypothetical protein
MAHPFGDGPGFREPAQAEQKTQSIGINLALCSLHFLQGNKIGSKRQL